MNLVLYRIQKIIIQTNLDLIVWQRSMDLAVECYNLTALFPKKELYVWVSQINRLCASIQANIAEGHGRGSRKELCTILVVCPWLVMRARNTYLNYRSGWT